MLYSHSHVFHLLWLAADCSLMLARFGSNRTPMIGSGNQVTGLVTINIISSSVISLYCLLIETMSCGRDDSLDQSRWSNDHLRTKAMLFFIIMNQIKPFANSYAQRNESHCHIQTFNKY